MRKKGGSFVDKLFADYKMLVRSAWRLFYHTHRTWAVSIEAKGLTTASFPILEMIVNHPGVTQQEITDQISLDKSGTSRACKLLETKGFIRREKCLQAAHAFRCYPTEQAVGIVEDVVRQESAHIHRLFDGEDPADMEAAVAILSRLTDQLKK